MQLQMMRERQERPDVSPEQRAAAELVKRIRKLRWIGMEEEAEQLQITLSRTGFTNCVFAEPQDTD
jgi:hypothetical protein